VKLGKLAPKRHLKLPALGDYLDKATTWPAVPAQGWEFAVKPSDWGLLGNDIWGDCTCAGACHLAQAQSTNAGSPLHGTTDQALALYTAVTGFDPNAGPSGNNPTDNGAACTDVLNYWQKTGIELTDANGKTVLNKIVGYAALDVTSVAQMKYAAYIFGGAYLGINLPQQCEDETDNWNFASGLPIAGGHCIVQVGEGSAGGKIVSWGMVIPFSNQFALSYEDEAYCVISESWLNQQGKSPSGLDLDGLLAAMKTI
jgi:hypothetical protein